jgi:hypothetical protein
MSPASDLIFTLSHNYSLQRGFAPAPKASLGAPASGANAIAPAPKSDQAESSRALDKEERRRRKAERKEEKRAKKEARRSKRVANDYDSDESGHRRRTDRSRSRSPRSHRSRDPGPDIYRHSRHPVSRSRTPPGHGRHFSSRWVPGDDDVDRERQRGMDRRQSNSRRSEPINGLRRDRD